MRPLAPIVWRDATVREVIEETPRARTLVLDVPGWPGHVAGQHLDVRLTAEDGYQASRSYSIASAPEDGLVAITVEELVDGEVSPYLVQEVRAGDGFEVRGPVGGHFTWSVERGGPLLLVGGGSGAVPLMAMLRHNAARDGDGDVRTLLSARSLEDLLYREELERLGERDGVDVQITLTRSWPRRWRGHSRRVDAEMLAAVGPPPASAPHIYVCGPTAFVETVADLLVQLGHVPRTIRAERFGPTGA